MNTDNILHVVIAEIGKPEGATIEERLEVAMKSALRSSFARDEESKLRAALGATLLSYDKDSEEFARLEKSIELLKKVSAMLQALTSGVLVDMDAMGKEIDEETKDFNNIKILDIWRQVMATEKKRV